MAAGGLVIKAQDGSMYFIRDEILEACRVADDELDDIEAMLEASDDVEGFSLSFARPVRFDAAPLDTARFGPANRIPPVSLASGDSTVMGAMGFRGGT